MRSETRSGSSGPQAVKRTSDNIKSNLLIRLGGGQSGVTCQADNSSIPPDLNCRAKVDRRRGHSFAGLNSRIPHSAGSACDTSVFCSFCPLAGLVRLGRRRKVARPQKPDYSGRDRNRPQCAKSCRYSGLRRMTGWDSTSAPSWWPLLGSAATFWYEGHGS